MYMMVNDVNNGKVQVEGDGVALAQFKSTMKILLT